MTTPLPIADGVLAEADQGSWCPKLCTYACPVVTATGHQDAVPWSFHRVVSDLGSGRLAPDDVGERLHRCTGCLACRDSCTFEQDVPAQILAGRAVAGAIPPAATARLDELRRAVATTPPLLAPGIEIAVLPGATSSADLDAVSRLLTAAGLIAEVLDGAGCCGSDARDLGDVELAETLAAGVLGALSDDTIVVTVDPHCTLPGREVRPVVDLLAASVDKLTFTGAPTTMTVHDPCLTARRDGVIEPPRVLLSAAGIEAAEPEGSRTDTVCSGAGLSLPLIDPDSAAAVARRRAGMLGAGPVVTWCGRAQTNLRDNGADVTSLWQVLADRLAMP